MKVKDYFKDWLKVIDLDELYKIVNTLNILYKSKECTPSYNNIFKVFNITPYNELCQVWIGEDPYPQRGVATGVMFGNTSKSIKLSPSLNIIKNSVIDFSIPKNNYNFDISLESWSKQGILLLNSALTTEVGKTGCHLLLWRNFIISLLKNLSEIHPGLIYVLWGTSAKTFTSYITTPCRIYKMHHPAFYARNNESIPISFFNELNKVTKDYFDKEIIWYELKDC